MPGAVGRSVPRKDGIAKATGAARYADDIDFPGMLFGRVVRTTIACGRVRAVHLDFDPTGFTIVRAADLPCPNVVPLLVADQPWLVEHEVRHHGEPLLLLAHADRVVLQAAAVRVEYELGTPEFDPTRSTQAFKSLCLGTGDLEAGFAAADLIVEGEYRTGHQEHLYLEPNGLIAVPDGDGFALHGSMQCPTYVLATLRTVVGDQVPLRVVPTEIGGGFGGKEEYPSVLAGHALLLARASGHPVKMIFGRAEDMQATTKRHPSIVRHRTGLTREGTIVAMDIDVLLDGGAYATLSPVVLTRGCIHAAGAYRCANRRVTGRVVRTNTPPNGAFRGFGVPQTGFAIEAHMDRIAEALGMDPATLRERNALEPGDTTITGQVLGADTSARAVLQEAVRRSDFHRRRTSLRGTDRGIGLALFFHGAGFTGDGERRLASKARLDLTATGVRIAVAATEFGQGTRTMLAQIVADAMALPYEAVEVAEVDTSLVVDSGPTVASRTCMIIGRLLEQCARELRARLGPLSPAEYLAIHGATSVVTQYERPAETRWDEETLVGDAYPTYSWGCDVVEVEIDRDTYVVRPVHVTAVQEFGRPIHPALAQGQIEGGTVQGLGFALLERVVMQDGVMANASLRDYVIPTTLDAPTMDVVMYENPYPGGPFGAKGLGELPMNGPAPAVINAIRHLGIDVREIPATPEVVSACVSG